jgi:outer membrane protein OmpA-like peptidoglycan-associated protein/opacity protein-like surface antigen
MKKVVAVLFITLIITISPLFAEINSGSLYVGNHVSAVQLIGDESSDLKAWWGLDFDYFFSQRIGTELSASIGWTRPGETKFGKSYITYLYPITANLKFNFSTGKKFIPYGLIGAGVLFWDLRDVTYYTEDYQIWERRGSAVYGGMQKDFIASAGLGFQYFLSKKWAIDSGFRYHMIMEHEKDMSGFGDMHSALWEFRVGIGYVFGKKTVVKVEKLKEIPVVKDDSEQQAKLEAERLEKERQARLEAERLEREKQAKLEAERLEKEKQARLEAERLERERKAQQEMEMKREITSQIINFPIGGSAISDSEKAKLFRIVRILKSHPAIRVELQGYSDSTGSRDLNMRLTKERAESVRAYLIAQGIDGSRLISVGYGPDKPIAPNDTSEGRSQNRRVEFKIAN